MVGLGHTAVEPLSSNEFRNAILTQHDELRESLAEAADLAAPAARSAQELEALRERARELFLHLVEHLAFEEHAFPQALRDVIGWGSVLQARIEESHERQRRALSTALFALEPDALDAADLALIVRALATSLLRDIEEEDAALLNADLDAVATDSEGG